MKMTSCVRVSSRADDAECDAKDQKADAGAKKRKLDGAAVGDGKRLKK